MAAGQLFPRDGGGARAELADRLAQHLERFSAPRLQLLLMMVAAAGAAFLVSVALLWSPADDFRAHGAALRGCGALRLPGVHPADSRLDRACIGRPLTASTSTCCRRARRAGAAFVEHAVPDNSPDLFSGGRSGGAGGSRQWAGSHSSGGDSERSWSLGFDLDDGIWLVVAPPAALARARGDRLRDLHGAGAAR